MVELATQLWRNYNVDGDPASLAKKPEKAKARAWGQDRENKTVEVGDADHTIDPAGYKNVVTSVALTAPRTWTLPAASALPDGMRIRVLDIVGGVTPTNTITVGPAGSDEINGSTDPYELGEAFGGVDFICNGVDGWAIGHRPVSGSTITQTGSGAVAYPIDQFLKELFVTPEQFGAEGDGTTDDTAALNAAFATGRSVRGRSDATYYHTGQITAFQFSNQKFYCPDQGGKCVINPAVSTATTFQWLCGPTATRVDNVGFSGVFINQHGSTANTIFQVRNVRYFTFFECRLQNVHRGMEWGDQSAATAAYILEFWKTDLSMRASHVDFCKVKSSSGRLRLVGCEFEGAYGSNSVMFNFEGNDETFDFVEAIGCYLGRFSRGFYGANCRIVTAKFINCSLDEFSVWAIDWSVTTGNTGGVGGIYVDGVIFGHGTVTHPGGIRIDCDGGSGDFQNIRIMNSGGERMGTPLIEARMTTAGTMYGISVQNVFCNELRNSAGSATAFVKIQGDGINGVLVDGVSCKGHATDTPTYILDIDTNSNDVRVGPNMQGASYATAFANIPDNVNHKNRQILINTDGTPARSRSHVLTVLNIAASATTDLGTYGSGGTLIDTRLPIHRRGKITGFAVKFPGSAVVTAGQLTFRILINGSQVGQTLVCTSSSNAAGGSVVFDPPIGFSAFPTHHIGADVVADGSFTPNNSLDAILTLETADC